MDRFLFNKITGKPGVALVGPTPADLQLETKLTTANRVVFGNAAFRPQQLDVVKAIMRNEDVFVIMPTGGGKSLCYSLPAVLTAGLTIVISPLISLIQDQVSTLLNLPSGGVPAASLTSFSTDKQRQSIDTDLHRVTRGEEPFLKILFLTPEMMVKSLKMRNTLQNLYQNQMLARFVIDECHCVSAWGHDFRKDYGQLGVLKREFPDTPIVALTATARKKVAENTKKILNITNAHVFNSGYDRPNLYFEVHEKPTSKIDTQKLLLEYVRSHPSNTTGIIYCMTKKECEETAIFLTKNDVRADYYHAGHTKTNRKRVQAAWLCGEVKVVCATIAYGMGIDKSDVRYVVHLSLAKSLEGYYQEAGRAGRDGKQSDCVVLYKAGDVSILARIMTNPPARKLSKKDEDMLEEVSGG